MANSSIERRSISDLNLAACHIVSLPDDGVDCSISNPNICVRCRVVGEFISGGGPDVLGSPGQVIAFSEWIFTVFIGVFGLFTNCLIIAILKRKKSERAFDSFLVGLACFDLAGSVTSVIASTSAMVILTGWDRGFLAQSVFLYGSIACYLARSSSSFMTVAIAVERYFVLAFPMKSVGWYTPARTKLCIGLVFTIALLVVVLLRSTSFYIHKHDFPRDIPSLEGWDYVIAPFFLARFWYGTLKAAVSAIDFWLPLPLLLLFNVLVFVELRKFARRREKLNLKQKREIRAIKMFLPVVVALFICNIEPYIHFYYIKAKGIVAREHFLGVSLSVAVNSAVNLPIYYFKGGSFRKEVRGLFGSGGKEEGVGDRSYTGGNTGTTASQSSDND